MKKFKLLLLALTISLIAIAQDPPDPPADEEEVPIGTDIIMLVAAGGAYFYKNIFGFKFKKSN